MKRAWDTPKIAACPDSRLCLLFSQISIPADRDVSAFSKAGTFFCSPILYGSTWHFYDADVAELKVRQRRDLGVAKNTARKNTAPLPLRFVCRHKETGQAKGV